MLVEIQTKKGLLDVCVLAAVSRESSYGYRIVRDVSQHIEMSESTLYPILKRLEAAGCLTTRTSEHGGRLRKYYAITDKGREKIRAFLDEWDEIAAVHQYVKEVATHEPQ